MQNVYFLVMGVLLVIAATAIVGLLANQEMKLHQLRQYEKELQVQLTRQKELDDYMERLRFLRHDARNYLLTMQALLAGGQYEKAKEFLCEVCKSFKLKTRGSFSDNCLIDELLSEKHDEAEKYGIPCVFHTDISHSIRYDCAMLCCAISATMNEALSRSRNLAGAAAQQSSGIDFYCLVTDEAKLDIRCTISTPGLTAPKPRKIFGRKQQTQSPQCEILSNLAESCNGRFDYTSKSGEETIRLSFTLPEPPELTQTI